MNEKFELDDFFSGKLDLLGLLKDELKVKDILSYVSEEEFQECAIRITQFAIERAGLKPDNIGIHFLRTNVEDKIAKNGFRVKFWPTMGRDDLQEETHCTIDFWPMDHTTSILDLDEQMNSLYRNSHNSSRVSMSFIIIDRRFIRDHGEEINPSPRFVRGVIPIESLINGGKFFLPKEALLGLGSLHPMGIVKLRSIYGSSNRKTFSEEREEVRIEQERVSDPYLSKPLTRSDQIYILMRFVESMSLISSE